MRRMEQLRQWRIDCAKSLDDAGKLIGVSGVQWHRYETGKRRIAANRVIDVEAVTGIPRHELRPDIFGAAQ